MQTIDIIVPPPLIYFKKYQRLLNPFYKMNIKWFPVWYFKKFLWKRGIKFRFLNILNTNLNNLNDIVCVDNDVEYCIKNLKRFILKIKKNVNSLFWFDNTDSASYINFEILDLVDLYFKKQVLRDRTLYNKQFLDNRYYSDYYIKKYSNHPYFEKFKPINILENEFIKPEDIDIKNKLVLSWNLAYIDFPFLLDERYIIKLAKLVSHISNKLKIKYVSPNKSRKLLFSANFSDFHYHIVGFQRCMLIETLKEDFGKADNQSIGFVSKKEYLNILNLSKAIFSPFGNGEVCLRDFETYIAGAALIKPVMDHIDTWPDLYKKGETYIPIPWEIEKWSDVISSILNNEDILLKVAKKGQNTYKRIWSLEGIEHFCDHLINTIIPP